MKTSYLPIILKKDYSFIWQKQANVKILLNKIFAYTFVHPKKMKKFEKELDFLKNKSNENNMHSYVFPYDFVNKYNPNDIEVFFDEEKELYYVLHFGKKLYFKKQYNTAEEVQKMYNTLLIEQDKESAHCYLNDSFTIDQGDVVLDVGAAEGNFSLEIIEKVKKLFIFETDPDWIEALNYTFEPWKEKVEIINKFVSNTDEGNKITLNTYFKNQEIHFIKLDVEGEEISILENCIDYLKQQKKLNIALCTYHNDEDADIIADILTKNSVPYSFSENYMLFIYHQLKPPYFRKGLIRAMIRN